MGGEICELKLSQTLFEFIVDRADGYREVVIFKIHKFGHKEYHANLFFSVVAKV